MRVHQVVSKFEMEEIFGLLVITSTTKAFLCIHTENARPVFVMVSRTLSSTEITSYSEQDQADEKAAKLL